MLTLLSIIGAIVLAGILIGLLTIVLAFLGLFVGAFGYIVEFAVIIFAVWVVIKLVRHLFSKL